ncbi:hypothetical protein [Bradyrhizobium yuanmingense]|uniref:hypothetical protein n=1 Tax=Bradyrhizobium yuanmingense TaxID=108015 RepID=UPI0012FE3DB0
MLNLVADVLDDVLNGVVDDLLRNIDLLCGDRSRRKQTKQKRYGHDKAAAENSCPHGIRSAPCWFSPEPWQEVNSRKLQAPNLFAKHPRRLHLIG